MWINAMEKKAFQRSQRRQASAYRRAGMSPAQIQAMAEYDRAAYLSERRYRSHTLPQSPFGDPETERSLMRAYPEALTLTLESQLTPDWAEELGEALAARVRTLTPPQRELVQRLVFEGRTQEEVARMRGVSRHAVDRMWLRTREKLQGGPEA